MMRELFKPAVETGERWYWTPAAVGVVGFISIVLLIGALWVNERRTAENLAVSRAVADLQRAAAYWHLWLEERVTGDLSVDLERDIVANERLATGLASMLLRGGRREDGEVVEPLDDPRLRKVAKDLEVELFAFASLAETRLERPEEAGVGTDFDQEFDAIFQRVKSRAEELDRLEREYLDRDRLTFRLRVSFSIAVWALIVAAALAGLLNREKRRQQVRDALRKSQNLLATTLSSIGDAVITTDLQGRVLFMNPVAERLTGWRREEATERPIEEVFRITRSEGQPVENPVARVLESGESVGMSNHTVLVDRRSETCYGIDEGAAPIRDDLGRLLGVVLVFRDVSRRRQTEKALREREAELQRAQKMEAVGRLAGGIAHDVNNYLGAIRGYCEVAMMKAESGPTLVRRMTAAVETADKVSALIRQLLAFSRRQPVQPAVLDLNRVVEDVKVLIERLLGEDIALETQLASERTVEIDRSQIEQTLVNLSLNARDAMPTGGRIVLATGEEELGPDDLERLPDASPGRYVRLSVSDTGCGIPAEVQGKIFDPFFTTKGASGSSGLGLATVYGIVRQNGGFITFESAVDEGTTFEIYLPASERPAEEDSGAAVSAPLEGGDGLRVLLVEDHAAMRASAQALLEVLGHEVQVAADGEEALALLDEVAKPFDLLITDVIMPGMTGRELYSRVRERFGDVHCLFISGYTDNVMMRHGFRQERVHFLSKPFSSEDLARKISEVLEEAAVPPGSV